jgi:hypothetical protein
MCYQPTTGTVEGRVFCFTCMAAFCYGQYQAEHAAHDKTSDTKFPITLIGDPEHTAKQQEAVRRLTRQPTPYDGDE